MADVKGVEAVIKGFRRIDAEMTRAIRREVGKTTLAVHRAARQAAPYDSTGGGGGHLRDMITFQFDERDNTGTVESQAPYSAFVEFGTGQRGSASEHSPLPNTYRHGPKPGMAAQPFMFPAVEQERPRFRAAMRRIVEGGGE